jgi:hypothetical protein
MKRDDVLAKAGELINGDRKEDYGDAYLNHMRIAEYWNNYLETETKITPTEDSFVDICGYAALAGEMSRVDVKRPDWG